MRSSSRLAAGLFAAGALLLAGGCASSGPTQQDKGRNLDLTGFLKDYSKLRPGGEGKALLTYRNPRADFSRYDKVLIEPVSIWAGDDSALQDVPVPEQQLLVDYLDAAIRNELAKDYEIVSRPHSGTLRIRIAITEAEGSSVVADSISTVIPQLRLLSGAASVASGTQLFVGKAGVEGEVVDAVTGIQLFAAVDRRVGSKDLEGSTDTWHDVQQAFDLWAQRIRTRLAEERTR